MRNRRRGVEGAESHPSAAPLLLTPCAQPLCYSGAQTTCARMHRPCSRLCSNPASPLGDRRSNEIPLSSSTTPSSPSGRGLPLPLPPPLDLDGGGPRGVRESVFAQDGSKRASDAPIWPPRWLKIAPDGSRWPPSCLSEAPREPRNGSTCSWSSPRTPPQDAQILHLILLSSPLPQRKPFWFRF